MTVTTTTTTMTPTTKPRLRVRTEPMPAHCFTAPEGAPACYGEATARSPACWLKGCTFRRRCNDFLSLARQEEWTGITSSPDSHRRAVLPDNAPVILNPARFVSRAFYRGEPPRTPTETKLWNCVERSSLDGVMAATARMAYRGGLIPVQAAIDIAEQGEMFHAWLDRVPPRERGGIEPYLGALVWTTAEITREALRAQGRPHVFGPKRHHEIWEALTLSEADLTRNALRKRRERVERYFRRFESRAQAAYRARAPVARSLEQRETKTVAKRRAA